MACTKVVYENSQITFLYQNNNIASSSKKISIIWQMMQFGEFWSIPKILNIMCIYRKNYNTAAAHLLCGFREMPPQK